MKVNKPKLDYSFPQNTHPAPNSPAGTFEAPLSPQERYREYLQYRALELRQGGFPSNDALFEMDGMMDELEDEGPDFYFPEEQTSQVSEDRLSLSPSEVKKELLKVRKELDQVRSKVRHSALDADTKQDLLRQINDVYPAIQKGGDLDGLRAQVEDLRQQATAAIDDAAPQGAVQGTEKNSDSEDRKAIAEFKKEIEAAKEEFKNTVEAESALKPADRETLINTFNQKADALLNTSDVEKARQDLDALTTEMEGQIQTTLDSAKEQTKKDRDDLRTQLMKVTDEPKFKENNGHWRQIGWAAGEKFKTALQTDNWSNFRDFITGLKDGDQRFVPIMRLVSAIYRTAGRDEAKAIQMINNLVPKEAVQAMIDKVTEDGSNLDWKGQGWPDNQDQVGPDKWHEWTPRGTSDFLRRSLDARKDFDPYQESKTA